jgi:hypothetical protein
LTPVVRPMSNPSSGPNAAGGWHRVRTPEPVCGVQWLEDHLGALVALTGLLAPGRVGHAPYR